MKKTFHLFYITASISLFSCNSQPNKHTDAVNSPAPEKAAIELKPEQLAIAKDLVCGMAIEEGGIADTLTHEGKIYGFCATECKAEFAKNPTAYLAEPK